LTVEALPKKEISSINAVLEQRPTWAREPEP